MKKILMVMIFALVGTVMSASPLAANAQGTTNPGSDPAEEVSQGKSTDAGVSAPGCTKCQIYQRHERLLDKTAFNPNKNTGESTSSGKASGQKGIDD
ncbi:hypothetical protein ACLVWU_00590 [Bdellovibrio sp. HCB290]|uniref:hypothetical protein n=1 Tax=Bdellovibrio sp. HCB290 TaxID=3394356 RepID=UPI0039B6CEAE